MAFKSESKVTLNIIFVNAQMWRHFLVIKIAETTEFSFICDFKNKL